MNTIKKTLDLLSNSEKKQALLILILILLMALLEMIGVVSIIPFVAILADNSLIDNNFFLQSFYNFTISYGVSNKDEFLFVIGTLVFILLVASLTLRALTAYLLTRFSLMREFSVGKLLIEGYLSQSYSWFLNRHSADFSKIILSEVGEVVSGTLKPLINIAAQTVVALSLITLIILINPFLALNISIVLISAYCISLFVMRNILHKLGSKRLKANKERFTIVSDAFNALKQVKLAGLENIYSNNFSKPAQLYAKNQSLSQAIALLPRYFIEIVLFGGIILLVLTLLKSGKDFNHVVPLISFYALAGYRLMPALQQIYSSLTDIRFSKPALDSLHKDLKNLKKPKDKKSNVIKEISFKKSIKLKNISFSYPKEKNYTLKNISLTIQAFSKIGIVGGTGGGKTTLIDIILGLLDSDKGQILIDGIRINSKNKRQWQNKIGYVPQQIYLSDSSIAENIAFGVEKEKIDLERVKRVAKIANLHDFIIKNLKYSYYSKIGERGVRLSGGQQQRIGIARALYHNPKVLILDEATSSLDNLTEKDVTQAIDRLSKKITIIKIAHRLNSVKNCDQIFLIDKGIIRANGTYSELLKKNKFFKMIANSNF